MHGRPKPLTPTVVIISIRCTMEDVMDGAGAKCSDRERRIVRIA